MKYNTQSTLKYKIQEAKVIIKTVVKFCQQQKQLSKFSTGKTVVKFLSQKYELWCLKELLRLH